MIIFAARVTFRDFIYSIITVDFLPSQRRYIVYLRNNSISPGAANNKNSLTWLVDNQIKSLDLQSAKASPRIAHNRSSV